MERNGFVKLPRRVLALQALRNGGALTRMEAVVDLYRIARFEAGSVKWGKSGRVIALQRGELVVTCAYLGHRWGWGKTTVASFIALLSAEGIVRRRMVGRTMVIAMLENPTEGDDGNAAEGVTESEGAGTKTGTKTSTPFPLENNGLGTTAGTKVGTKSEHNNKKVKKEEGRREEFHTQGAQGENFATVLSGSNPYSGKAVTEAAVENRRDTDAAYAAELRNSRQALERMAIGQRMSVAEVVERLDAFANEMEATAQSHRNRADYRRHFYNWLRLGREIGRRNALAQERLGHRQKTKAEINREVMQRCMDDISAHIAAAEHDEEARRFRMEVLGWKE